VYVILKYLHCRRAHYDGRAPFKTRKVEKTMFETIVFGYPKLKNIVEGFSVGDIKSKINLSSSATQS